MLSLLDGCGGGRIHDISDAWRVKRPTYIWRGVNDASIVLLGVLSVFALGGSAAVSLLSTVLHDRNIGDRGPAVLSPK